jgi:hypothetical protein
LVLVFEAGFEAGGAVLIVDARRDLLESLELAGLELAEPSLDEPSRGELVASPREDSSSSSGHRSSKVCWAMVMESPTFKAL